jgi:hypothetical protein
MVVMFILARELTLRRSELTNLLAYLVQGFVDAAVTLELSTPYRFVSKSLQPLWDHMPNIIQIG